MHLLPPLSLRVPVEQQRPTGREIKLDVEMLEKMLGDVTGNKSYSLAVHFGFKTIVIRYYDNHGTLTRSVELIPGEDKIETRIFNFIYPIMQALHYTVFNSG